VLKKSIWHKTQLRDQLQIHLLRNPPPPTKNANQKLWQSMLSLRFLRLLLLLLLLQIPVESLNR
jgi:hypothetical protein